MASQVLESSRGGLGATERRDWWWLGPLATALGLGAFVVYATFRVFHNDYYFVPHGQDIDPSAGFGLISPFYSPYIKPDWLPVWFSPAILILWAPGGFRLTCYYYRKAYYRAYFLDPPACAVGEPKNRKYRGETRLFLFQNLHRYFLYVSLLILLVLAYDVYLSCRYSAENGAFGMSLGTLVLAINVALLSLYTFSCHSLRHLVGGRIDCFSCVAMGQARYKMWSGASLLNKNHMLWAWCSLFSVGFTDFYVWMTASGVITDIRFF